MSHGGASASLAFVRRDLFRGRPVGSVLRLVLVVTVAMAGAVVVGQDPVSAGAAPAVVAQGAEPCAAEAADEQAAVDMAARCGAAVEVLDRRSETTQLWAKPDGGFTARIHGGPERFLDSSGVWRDVDLTLQRRADGSVAPLAHPRGLTLAGQVGAGAGEVDLVSVLTGSDVDAQRLAMTWNGALPEPVLHGNEATYVDALPGIDVKVTVSPVGFEQFLVVKGAAALARMDEARLGLKVGGLSPVLNATGGISFENASGDAVVATPTALMWDAAVDSATGMPANVVRVGLNLASPRAVGAAHALQLSPDEAWLTDPGRQFPITIDPGLTADKDLYVRENSPNSNYMGSSELLLGTSDGGSNTARSFLRWGWSPIFGKTIVSGSLKLWEHHAYSCRTAEWQLLLSSWVDHTTTWNNMPGGTYYSSSTQTRGHPDCTGDGWVAINAKGLLQKVADDQYAYNTMLIKAASETNNDGWKRFNSDNAGSNRPYLEIDYRNPPSVTNVKAADDCDPCASPATVRVLNPPLQATVSDPAGTSMTVRFEVWNSAKSQLIKAHEVSSGNATVSWQPTGLVNATQYHFRVHAEANPGAGSGWSAWSTFTTNTAGPSTPTNVAANGDCYLSCTSPAMLRSAQPTFKASVAHPFGDNLTVTFEVWNSGKSSIVKSGTVGSVAAGTTAYWQPNTALPQNQQLHLKVKSTDTYSRPSAWSGWYTFTTDATAPVLPTVSSSLYKHKDSGTYNGGVGMPGVFTFTPGTSTDVVQFKWRFSGGSEMPVTVAAGASVDVTITPVADLLRVLEVQATDAAGNTSGWVQYPFLVRTQPVDAAYWKLDGTTSAASGGSGYAGVLSGAPSFEDSAINPANPAASGKGLRLDGIDDYMSAPRVLATDHAAGFSVSAWVKPSALSGYHTVVAQQGANTYAFKLYYHPDSNRWCFNVLDADNATAGWHGTCSGLTPPTGVWTHLAGVYDPVLAKVRLYVNGGTQTNYPQLPGDVSEAAAPARMWAATGAWQVGRANTGSYFAGVVDEVRAYQRVLSEVEVKQMFLDCRTGDCPPIPAGKNPHEECWNTTSPMCVGEWKLDEGAGTSAADSSDQNNALTVHGTAGFTAAGYEDTPGLSFDGTAGGYAATAGPVVLTDQSFTVSVWAKLTNKDGWRSVVTQDGSIHSAFRIDYELSADKWCFLMRVEDTVNAGYVRVCDAAPKLGVWTHLVGVYDRASNEIRFYVNSRLAGTATFNTPWKAAGPLAVGRVKHPGGDANGHNDWFVGQIDLVRVFQGALSSAQVADLYVEQVAPPKLMVRWDFDEGEGPETYDYSENGNTGHLSGTGVEWVETGDDGLEGPEGVGIAVDGIAGFVKASTPVVSTTDSVSMAAWVKLSATSTGQQFVLAQSAASSSAIKVFWNPSDGKWVFQVRSTNAPDGWVTVRSDVAAQLNTWVHLVGVFDAATGQVSLYVNGQKQTTVGTGALGEASAYPLIAGAGIGEAGYGNFLAGVIDSVGVYQGALSDAQAQQIFQGQQIH